MTAEYWDTFHRNAKATLQARAPSGWKVTELYASAEEVRARVEWAGDHSLTLSVTGRAEDAALDEIAAFLDGCRREQEGQSRVG